MTRPLRLLFVSSEIFPLAKTGGLADVCAALPMALARRGVDIRLVMPGYPEALDRIERQCVMSELGDLAGLGAARLVCGRLPGLGLPIWLVDCPQLYRRSGGLYQDADANDWPDNPERFALLAHAAVRLATGAAGSDWLPDLVHCHDWHAGLVPLLLQDRGASAIPTVFTIHNLAFPGLCPADRIDRLGLPRQHFTPAGYEFYGQISFLKAGIRFARRLTTVSPTYAAEIQTPAFGHGLDGLLRERARDLVGILNGIDTSVWDPAGDPMIASSYSADDPAGKRHCKAELQREFDLDLDPEAPLTVSASRITNQKMADVLVHVLPQALARLPRMQFALLGQGEPRLEAAFQGLMAAFPGRVSVRIGYDEESAHRIHAGGDILVHGSRFEPCGLVQLYAMRYGTAPVVRRVGGLADTVVDCADWEAQVESAATGFVFDEPTEDAMLEGIERAAAMFRRRTEWERLRERAMSRDFGWARSADRYLDLYRALIVGPRRAAASLGRAA